MKKNIGFTVEVPVPISILVSLEKEFGDGIHYKKGLHIVKEIIYKHQRCFAPMLQYFPYDSQLKRAIVGGNEFYVLWRKLEEMGILEVRMLAGGREFSIAGKVCKYYRLSLDNLNCNVKVLEHTHRFINSKIQDEVMCKAANDNLMHLKVTPSTEHIESRTQSLSEEHLKKKFFITDTGIQYEYMKELYHEIIHDQIKAFYISFEKINMAMSYQSALKVIEYKVFYVCRSETNGRIYHNLTNIPSELLKLISINNETLCEIDLRCSQPVLLAYLINEILNKRKPILEDGLLEKVINNNLPPLLFSSSPFSDLELDQMLDIEVFIEKAQLGKLYEYFAIQLYGECTEEYRKEAKVCFIESLYSGNHFITASKAKFQRVFPDLGKLLRKIKTELVDYFEAHMSFGSFPELKKYTYSKSKGNKSAHESGNDYLSVKLQEIESTIFINIILSDLHQRGYSVLPKHDSILCAESDELSVKDCIIEHLDSILGKGKYLLKSKLLKESKIIDLRSTVGDALGF